MKTLPQMLVITAVLIVTACGDKSSNGTATDTNQVQTKPAAQVQTAVVTPEMRGKKLYKRCQACHTLDDGGRHRVGPNLYGIFGMHAGTKAGFTYSKAMNESEIVWTAETLSAYLEDPRGFMPGNRMSFVGLRKPEDRDAVIAFMKAETSPE